MTSPPGTVAEMLPHLTLLHVDLGQVSLPKRVALDFDVFLPGKGWCAPEQDSKVWFRWLSKEATIQFLIDRSEPVGAELHVYSSIDEDILNRLYISCDELPVSLKKEKYLKGWVYYFELPVRPSTKVELTTLRLRSEYQRKFEGDHRLLSLAFTKLVIGPAYLRENGPDLALPLALQAVANEIFGTFESADPHRESVRADVFECRMIGSLEHVGPKEREQGPWQIAIAHAAYAGLEGSVSFEIAAVPGRGLLLRFREDAASDTIATLFNNEFEVLASRTGVFADLSVMPVGRVSKAQLQAAAALLRALPAVIGQFADARTSLRHRLLPLLTTGIVIDMGQPLDDLPGVSRISGLADSEAWSDVSVRWTKARELVIALSKVPEDDFTVCLDVERVYEGCMPGLLQFKCGTSQKEILLKLGRTTIEFPVSAVGASKTISVGMPNAVSPAELGRENDTRSLCLALAAIRIQADDRG